MIKKKHYPLSKLTEEQVSGLLEIHDLKKPKLAISHRRRNGVNIEKNLSVYTYERWYNWNRHHRKQFRECFHPTLASRILSAYFIGFPAEEGHLDLMEGWVNKPGSGVIATYALRDNQHIWLGGKKIVLNKGEGIIFSLQIPHKVDRSPTEALWANIMVTEYAAMKFIEG